MHLASADKNAMNSQTPDKTLSALVKMLDDPDDRVFSAISHQFLAMGNVAVAPLETALANCFDEQVTERIYDLLDRLHQANLLAGFTSWLQGEDKDLLKGFILVSQTGFRNIDEVEISALVAQIKTDVWIELHDGLTAMENIRVINHVLYKIHRFEGNRQDISAPENSFINTLLESKKGNPVSLGLLYLIISKQLGLPVFGVDLPQHFILAYLKSDNIEHPQEKDVLFYINPFNDGAIFSRHEIDLFLIQMKIKPETTYFQPCSNTVVIRKLINNLIFSYTNRGIPEKLTELEDLLNAIP